MVIARKLGFRRRAGDRNGVYSILLTGTFYSENWIAAQLRPLAASSCCGRIYLVSTQPVPPITKVVAIHPPRWLCRVLGDVPARLVAFTWSALRVRPDILGGFHLLVNGLLAALLAPIVGARSMYICTGGPLEIIDGGFWAENRLFQKLGAPDAVVERQLVHAAREFDILVVRGERARRYLRDVGVTAPIHVVTGGIDSHRFAPSEEAPEFDLILVGRLTAVKRADVFLRAVQMAARRLPNVSACIVGGGPLLPEMKGLAAELGVSDRVRFVGHEENVERWLRSARIFVLTSDTEGLALALIEAMLCGLPAIVSDVGELGELVSNGLNGYCVPRGTPEAFAERIVQLLSEPRKLESFSTAARQIALRFEIQSVSQRWANALVPAGETTAATGVAAIR